MKPTLLIMAAGLGSRYGSLKQVDGLGPSGEYMLDYAVYDAIEAGFGKIVFIIRQAIAEELQQHFSPLQDRVELDYVVQEVGLMPKGLSPEEGRTKPWGTGHAVWVAASAIEEPFAVINADDFYGREAFLTLGKYLAGLQNMHAQTYAMVGYKLSQTLSDFGAVSRGICEVDASGYLQTITERTHIQDVGEGLAFQEKDGQKVPLTGQEVASMNMWGFTPAIFAELESTFRSFVEANRGALKSEFYLPSVVGNLILEGKASAEVLRSDASWFGVTYQEDKVGVVQKLGALVKEGVYPSPLF